MLALPLATAPWPYASARLPLIEDWPMVSELASDRVMSPAFGMITVPKSLLLLFNVKLPLPVRVRVLAAALKIPCESVLVPAALIVLLPVSVTVRLSRSTSSVAARMPPPKVMFPLPNPLAAATESVPELMVVPPVKVLLPESARVPEPDFVSVPLPEITPL